MRSILLLGCLILLGGCAQQEGGMKVDLAAEQQKVIDTDREFAAETLARGGDGWADYFAKDAVMFPSSGKIMGQDSIRTLMKKVMTPEAPKLLWEPETAVVAGGGDMAYSIGRWESVADTEGEENVLASGYYLTVWKKTPDGDWRVAADMGNQDPPPKQQGN